MKIVEIHREADQLKLKPEMMNTYSLTQDNAPSSKHFLFIFFI